MHLGCGTCDGAVIYVQNWKTLMKNSAKVIAITIVSLALIGGAFFGVAYLLLGSIEPLTAVRSRRAPPPPHRRKAPARRTGREERGFERRWPLVAGHRLF